MKSGRFSLTLTLSRWERGQQSCALLLFGDYPANSVIRFFTRLNTILPLTPAATVREHGGPGEGRGEGERTAEIT
jgi:hypothetical protein